MAFFRFLLLLLIAAILSGAWGFAVYQGAMIFMHVPSIGAQCLGIAAWAAVLLVLIAVMGQQAKGWN